MQNSMSGSLRARVKIARPNQSQNYIDTVKTKDLTKTIQYFFNHANIRIIKKNQSKKPCQQLTESTPDPSSVG